METLKSSSLEEVNSILRKSSMTLADRFKLDSFTHRTLASEYSDMNNSELMEVYRLEIQNLKRLLNSVAILCGVYGQDAIDTLKKMTFVRKYIEYVSSEYTGTEKDMVIFGGLLGYLMAECDENKIKYPIFVGKVPQKLFQFRQTTAESWWASFLTAFKTGAGHVYAKRGAEEAFGYALANIAYYLNKSQPFKFHPKSSDANLNDTITRICNDYIGEMFGDTSMLKKGNVVFYQDL